MQISSFTIRANMLLRCSSTLLMNSGIPQYCKDSAPLPEPTLQKVQKSRSCSEIPLSSSMGDYSIKKMSKALSDTDVKEPRKPSRECMSMHGLLSAIAVDGEEHKKERDVEGLSDRLWFLSNAGLNLEEGCEAGLRRERLLTEVMMGGGSTGSGRRIGCGGSGGGGDDGGGGGDENEDDSEYGGGSPDLYYKKMIEANPGNPLLLSNYARYLKEVRADLLKAEKYCERAVMANPDDGNILSLYAELKWQIYKDPVLAENYFAQSVKAAPEDCYVLASYANFLWDAEEQDEDEKEMTDADYSSLST